MAQAPPIENSAPESEGKDPLNAGETLPGKNAGRKPNRKKSLFIILAVFALAGIIGFFFWLAHKGIQETDDATLEGYLRPVSARIAGNVQRVLVDDNDLVKAGQLLVELDPTDYELALSQAQHNLEAAKAQAVTAQRNITLAQRQATAQITQAQGAVGASRSTVGEARQAVAEAQAGVATAQQNLAQQEANYQRALADYQRYASLNPEAVSAQQLDTARTNMRVAEANRDAARAGISQAQARVAQARAAIASNTSRVQQAVGGVQSAQAQNLQVDVARSQYENALVQVKVAEDQVKQAKLNLQYTRIIAPSAGRVGKKTVEIGQRIQPGEPLMTVVPQQVWVVANFKETQLQDMTVGQPVEIDIDAFPNHEFRGVVDSFSPASGAQFALLPPENATGNFTKITQRIPVKILLDRETLKGYEDRLVPGMSVIVKVDTNHPGRRHRENTVTGSTR